MLNYLGYSWVDKGMNFDEALKMIQKAVDLRPNDGYIVDSLGWAYYQLGRDDEAVAALETAVELRADDPVINDHLGDAYWTVGRKREALFQWAHARDLEPEKDALPKILAKLEHGLDGAARENTVTVEKGESLWDIALRVYGDAALYERILRGQQGQDKRPQPDLSGNDAGHSSAGDELTADRCGTRCSEDRWTGLPKRLNRRSAGMACRSLRAPRSTSRSMSPAGGPTATTRSRLWSCSPTTPMS